MLTIRRISSFLGGCLLSLLGLSSCVKSERTVMISHLFDEILLMKVSEHFSSNSSIDFEFIADNGNSEIQEFGCLLHDSFVCLCIEEDSIVKLFLYLYFGPTLLLCLTTGFLVNCWSWGFTSLVAFATLGVFSLLLLGALKVIVKNLSFTISDLWLLLI